jgi:hypothetical protein
MSDWALGSAFHAYLQCAVLSSWQDGQTVGNKLQVVKQTNHAGMVLVPQLQQG